MKIFLGRLNGSLKNLISIKPATHVNVGECKIEKRNAQEEKAWKETARRENERVRGQESESCPATPEKR
jgi:fatty acid-binding protein DegV